MSAERDAVSLKGTTRGLEILISGPTSVAGLETRLTELLAEAPGVFAGSDARVVFAVPLPSGALACLEQVAARFQLAIVEVGPLTTRRNGASASPGRRGETRRGELADGTGPVGDDGGGAASGPVQRVVPAVPALLHEMASRDPGARGVPGAPLPETAGMDVSVMYSAPYEAVTIEEAPDDSARVAAPAAAPIAAISAVAGPMAALATMDTSATTAIAVELAGPVSPGTRLVVGPVRSGVIVDHPGHVIVVGDVNPGAEVRAEGSIIVVGRLRGVAHAAIGRAIGFIIALSLQPQQLRIGRTVARAADADRPSDGAEIAYATGETIVVERFSGRLPSGLAASM